MYPINYWQRVVAPFVRSWVGARTERGASLVEYALLVGLIALVCIVAMTFLGGATSSRFNAVGSSLGGS